MANFLRVGDPLPLGFLRLEEHIRGCTVYWKKPPEFGRVSSPAFFAPKPSFASDKIERNAYRQQVVVHEMPSATVIKHTLINPQINLATFDTLDARAYDIQITLIAEVADREITARGCLKIVAAKTLALDKNKHRNVRVVPLIVSASAIHCRISWPTFYERSGRLRLRLYCEGRGHDIPARPKMEDFTIRTVPGRNYSFELRVVSEDKNRLIAGGDVCFRASKLIPGCLSHR